MKVLFAYLPTDSEGFMCISQNRFSKARGDCQLIYPVVPATGLTMLKKAGFEVSFIDSIFEQLSSKEFIERIKKLNPELLVFESKTPIIKKNWILVEEIKKVMPKIIVAVVGDHVSVLPEETLKNSKIDFVLTGGDFDVSMLKLAKHLADKKNPLPKGCYYKKNNKIVSTGKYELLEKLDELPLIDRNIIPWKNYHENWQLHKHMAYILASRGCPYKCTFCSWPQMLYGERVRERSPKNVVQEMQELVEKLKVKEIFFDDDTFTWHKEWVQDICNLILEKKIKVVWSCNGRVDNLDFETFKLMKKAGCRLIKFGVESASQETLNKIRKGYNLKQVFHTFDAARKAGILRHATVMLGYPWETRKDIVNTIELVKKLNVDTVQFTMPIVYPGTKLFEEAKQKGWLRFNEGDWEKFDMSEPTLLNPELSSQEIIELCENAWKKVYFRPKYIFDRLTALRSIDEIKWLYRGTKGVLGNIKPLKKKECTTC
ncbi:MAG: radical SAM protein [archaeon]